MASSIPCGPCNHDSVNKNAEKWCTDCNEGFCNGCEKAHKSMKMSRDHNLILIEDYRVIENMNIVSECQDHGSKLEMYCKIHEMAICITCFPAKHKDCSDAIIPLTEASRDAKTSTSFTDLEHTINDTLENIEICLQDREAAEERIEKQEMAIKKIISNTRENITKHLDNLERKLFNELSTTYSSCKSKYGTLKNQLNRLEKEIKRLKGQTTNLKRFAPDLHVFLSTQQMTKEVHEEVNVIKEAIRSVRNYDIEIEIHQGITSLLKDVDCFARIKVDESTISCPFKETKIDQAQIQVQTRKSVHDTRLQLKKKFTIKQTGNKMYISGCIILANGNFLIADYEGLNKLLEYNEDGNFIRDIQLSAKPYNLTTIETDQIAVSYSTLSYIEVIDIKQMIVLKKVKFKNSCLGISYSEGKIFVVVNNEGIVVLDIEGTMLNTVKCTPGVYNITTCKTRIYYTQLKPSTIYCCSRTGEEIWNFNDNSFGFSGISTDRDQNVFVVGNKINNLMVLQDDGKESKILLSRSEGLEKPSRLCYNKEKNTLLVCNSINGNVFLYSVI
ncbi:E3 ubiquitin-protein ligase TRIM39-like [Mytilus edulis]|uniref:E3 ubiquitin-protein ligase TRIM39-like n=1 Tax=Mytilus edulis TaxID=6550 RepID=UPI0039F0BA96